MAHTIRSFFVVFLLLFSFSAAMGCKPKPVTYSSRESIERPAKALDEEKGVTDHIGEATVAVLVVGGALVLIAVPFLIFLL